MILKTYSQLEAADMLVSYLLDDETGAMGLALVPLSMRAQVVPHREDLRGVREIETLGEQFKRPSPLPPRWTLSCTCHSPGTSARAALPRARR